MTDATAESYEQTWERVVLRWNELCPDVDVVLDEYAGRLGGTVELWLHDTPSRVLTWADTRAQYSISLLLSLDHAPALHLWAAAWRDDEEQLRRRTLKLEPAALSVPVHADALHPCLAKLTQRLQLLAGALIPGQEHLYTKYKHRFAWTIDDVRLTPLHQPR